LLYKLTFDIYVDNKNGSFQQQFQNVNLRSLIFEQARWLAVVGATCGETINTLLMQCNTYCITVHYSAVLVVCHGKQVQCSAV